LAVNSQTRDIGIFLGKRRKQPNPLGISDKRGPLAEVGGEVNRGVRGGKPVWPP
jgi:hypothetical protein